MFDRIRALFTRDPDLIDVPLGLSLAELQKRLTGMECSELESEWESCTDYEFLRDSYRLTATVQSGIVKGYIHDTAVYRNAGHRRIRKLIHFLEFYGEDSDLLHMVDNGAGHLYRSEDRSVRAAYSYLCDVFSVSYFELDRKARTSATEG